jgi:hypothetical protein
MQIEMILARQGMMVLTLANSLVWCFVASEGVIGAFGLG